MMQQEKEKMTRIISLRLTIDTIKEIEYCMKKWPRDYPTQSHFLRSAVFWLRRGKEKMEEKYHDFGNGKKI